MSYKTKTQREAAKRIEADKRLQMLLIRFGNFILEKRGIKESVTNEDMTDFAESLK